MSSVSPVAMALPTYHRPRRLSMRGLKRTTMRIFALFLFWCVAAHASVVCIVHCQVTPWIEQLLDQPLPLFVCDFGGRTSNQDAQTSSKIPLPEIVQLMMLATLLMIVCILSVVGSIAPLWVIPLYQSPPPLIPPPRCFSSWFPLPISGIF